MPRQMLVGLLAACCLVGLAVGGVAATDLSADRSLETAEADPGETIEIELSLSAGEEDEIELVSEEFDAELEIVASNSEQGQVLEESGSWSVVYLEPVDSDVLTITYQVPNDASDGTTYTLSGEVITADDVFETGTTTITVAGDDVSTGDDTSSDTTETHADDASTEGDGENETEDTLVLSVVVPSIAILLTIGVLARRS